ncbi:hypothetical protein [Nocardia iowensis]|uniref:Uncharacterized protein n=1 Tax=Nocardia iowensis TaxID=204891 RepID=A0ABX8RZA1_NOCIO|nr:hypothetical protein [Nocardia iowensis]QXN94601.1 hypothetical protein KV110_17040 [Nocardia iowensis]
MSKPTPAQRHVLKALQNRAVELTAMINTANQRIADTGQRPPPSWFEDYHGVAILHDALEKAAYAGGVPQAWIDHVRERGRNGITWRADLGLRAGEPLDLDRVLGELTADVQLLQDWTVFDIARRTINPSPGPPASGDLEANLRALRARTHGIANLLGLDAELGEQLWGTTADWAHAGAALVDGLSAEAVINRWTIAAYTDTRRYALQAIALGTAGIVTDTAEALPSAQNLATAISSALPPVQPQFRAATDGAAIDSALTAAEPVSTAGAGVETRTGPPLFSQTPEPDSWSFDGGLDWEIPAPQFSSAAELFGR